MSIAISIRTAIEYAAALGFLIAWLGGGQLPFSSTSPSTSDTIQHPGAIASLDKREFLVYPDRDLDCPSHPVKVRIFSSAPLIIHISDFISPSEAEHLISISEGLWTPSTVLNPETGQQTTDDTVRKSERARIPRDKIVQCIEHRALSLQGYPRNTFIERLWTQRYYTGGHYAAHYDWSSADPSSRRASTFMVYLAANCTGGGTRFPLLQMPGDERWCDVLDCGDGAREAGGVTFLPRAGAAVFWENFDAEGRGWKEGLHAALPVVDGYKVGLNIWSSYQRGLEPHHLAAQAEGNG